MTKWCYCEQYRPHPTTLGHCRCNHFADSHDPDTGRCTVRIQIPEKSTR